MLRIYVFLFSLGIGNCFAQSQEKEILYFEHAGHSLTEESRKTVDLLLQRTSLEKIVEISLSGHTDSDGSDSFNMQLSRERVGVVQRYLIERGVSQNKIRKDYYGKTRPIASNATTEGKQKNRRVEIMLTVSTSEKQPSNEVANADTDQVTSSELPCSSIIHQTEKKVLYFNSGKHELTTSSLQVILDELEKLRNFHLVRIELAGHTDSDGPEILNINLSKERADIVERYLLSRNVPFSKINSSYFGESKPIASNATGEGKRKNRRVEMLIRYDECASDDNIIVTSQEETTSKKMKEPEKEPLKTIVQSTPGQQNAEVTTNKLETNDRHQDTNIKQKEVEPVKDTPIQIVESSVKTDSTTDKPERIEPLVTSTSIETGREQQKTEPLATKKTQQPDTLTNLTGKIQTVEHPVTSNQTSTQPLSVEPTVQIQEVSPKDQATIITPVTTVVQTTGQEVTPKTEISNTDTTSNRVKQNDVQVNNEPTPVNNVAPIQPTASTNSANSTGESKNPTVVLTKDSTTNQPVTVAQEVIPKTELSNTDTISNTVKHNDVQVSNAPTPVNNLTSTQPTTPTNSADSIGESKNPKVVQTQDSTTNQPLTTAQEVILK
ncbi:MAG TPA: OmpA family protein, partial [Cyclobacteriaceae bacterium]|nr:OmpA family protein [Cyclobacteriaceae bacterium]